jgi:hypothetical protein
MQAQILRCLDYGKLAWGMMFGIHDAVVFPLRRKKESASKEFFSDLVEEIQKAIELQRVARRKNFGNAQEKRQFSRFFSISMPCPVLPQSTSTSGIQENLGFPEPGRIIRRQENLKFRSWCARGKVETRRAIGSSGK